MSSVLLIDLSSIVHRHWHACTTEINPDATSERSIAQVHRLASGHDHVAICCDSGKSFRAEVNPEYKANRPKERNEPLHHQMAITRETLAADGFPVWSAPGFEADDVIASAVRYVLAHDETTTVLIASADKDLLALVGPRVSAKSIATGDVVDEAGVRAKFGVSAEQITDYLTMVGDSSDNIAGIKGVGPKRAAELLGKFGSLAELYEDFSRATPEQYRDLGLTPALVAALDEFAPRLDETRQLVLLRTDVELPFADIWKPREPAPSEDGFSGSLDDHLEDDEDMTQQELLTSEVQATPDEIAADFVRDITTPAGPTQAEPKNVTPIDREAAKTAGAEMKATQALVVREPEIPAPPPAKYELQLDPRSPESAYKLSVHLAKSRMFSGYGSTEAVLSTVMAGRELGLPAIASLRGFHNIDGKHAMSAQLMVALVLKSGLAEFFEPVELSDTVATFETKRVGARNPVKLSHTIEMARRAWRKGKTDAEREASWQASGWGTAPQDMLVARATSRLCRLVYPDILGGLYTPEELLEVREGAA